MNHGVKQARENAYNKTKNHLTTASKTNKQSSRYTEDISTTCYNTHTQKKKKKTPRS